MGFFSRQEALEWLGYVVDESVPDSSPSPAAAAQAQYAQSTPQSAGLLSPSKTPERKSVNGLSSLSKSSLTSILSSRVNSCSGDFYAVARGRQPGIYPTWPDCLAQVHGFSDARYKKFRNLTDALEFLAVYGGGGHFSQFTSQAFEPDDTASFGDEWARLSQSQGWTRGTKHYSEQRACALRNELQTHFFASSSRALPEIKSEESEGENVDVEPLAESDHQLHGFQAMCRAVGKSPGDTVNECKRILKQTLVNIVDLIDAYRTRGKSAVRLWTDFEAFKAYTLNSSRGDRTIPVELAKRDPLLKCFLQDFRAPRGHFGGAIGRGGAVIKKRARCEEDSELGERGHQNKRIMCS